MPRFRVVGAKYAIVWGNKRMGLGMRLGSRKLRQQFASGSHETTAK